MVLGKEEMAIFAIRKEDVQSNDGVRVADLAATTGWKGVVIDEDQ